MLQSLHIDNFTVFDDTKLDFCNGLNIIVGENGLGKTHLLKLPYVAMAVSAEEGKKQKNRPPTKDLLQKRIAEKLSHVFRPEKLGRLARRQQGRNQCKVQIKFSEKKENLVFGFSTNSSSEVAIEHCPTAWCKQQPVFLPSRELLTIYPGFVSLYESREVEFEETWRDTCLLLGAPAIKGPRDKNITRMLEPLEKQMDGKVVERNGRFYLHQSRHAAGELEMPLVAEGWRKLAMLARLIATGSLLSKNCLFWDEPEANLNPRLIREVANAILGMCAAGIQVFVATHSLFLLRELEILQQQEFKEVECAYFGLEKDEEHNVIISQSENNDVQPLAMLDEELKQSDRFLQYMQTNS